MTSPTSQAPTAIDAERWRQTVERAVQHAHDSDTRAALHAASEAFAALPALPLDDTCDEASVNALVRLGVLFFESGYRRRARDAYLAARVRLDALPELASSELAARLHNNLGQVHAQLGDLTDAERELREAVRLRENNPHQAEHAVAMDNLGSVLGYCGQQDEARALQQNSLHILTALGPDMASHAATTMGNLSQRYAETGDFTRATAYRLRAFDTHLLRDGPEAPETLIDAQQLGALCLQRRSDPRLDWVVGFLLQAGGEEPDPSMRFVAEMLKQLAMLAHDAFRLDLTERLLTRAVAILKVCEGDAAPDTLSALMLLSNAQRAGGAPEQARATLQRVLEGYQALGRSREAIETRIALGRIYRELGALPLATEMLKQTVAEIRALPEPDDEQLASALGNLAQTLYDDNQPDLAERYFREGLAALASDPDSAERPWLQHGLALLHYHKGDHDAALSLLKEALQHWEAVHGAGHPFSATCAVNLALLHWSTGQPEDALAAFAKAEAVRDRTLRRQLALGSEAQRLAYANAQLGDLSKVISFCLAHPATSGADGSPAVQERMTFAAALLLRRKGLVLDAVTHTLQRARENLSDADRRSVDMLRAAQARLTRLHSRSLWSDARPDPGRLKALTDEESTLQATLSRQVALREPELAPVGLDEVRHMLGDGTLLLEYVRYRRFSPRRDSRTPWRDERYALLCTSRSFAPRWFDLGEAGVIDSSIDRLLNVLRDRRSRPWKIDAATRDLRRRIVAPAARILEDYGHLLIAPDSQLALVPFGLPGLAASKRAATRVRYISSGRHLVRARAQVTPAAEAPVVVAAPDFDAEVGQRSVTDDAPIRTHKQFRPLPGTDAEGAAVAAWLPKAQLLTGPDATVDVLKALHSPRVLHIATHGIFAALPQPRQTWRNEVITMAASTMLVSHGGDVAEANPMLYSGLVLAGANRTAAGGNPGVISALEIATMDLRGTELVVLSACDTGRGHRAGGSELAGLRRALSIAGAARQVTSLWKVDDLATCTLMTHFYRRLANGMDCDEALRRAQRQTATDSDHPEWAHPYYWAAFVCASG